MERKLIVAATGNVHKLREFREILPEYEFAIAKDLGFSDEVEETGKTFEENALIKARAVANALHLPALADDSGLCVDALGGAPGIFSARYSFLLGSPAERKDRDAENRRCLLQGLQGKTDRRAHFCCAVALVFPSGLELTAEGKSFGRILEAEEGSGGFGYDPLFWSDELQKSFASAREEEKNAVSHRGRALQALKERLASLASP